MGGILRNLEWKKSNEKETDADLNIHTVKFLSISNIGSFVEYVYNFRLDISCTFNSNYSLQIVFQQKFIMKRKVELTELSLQ